MAGFYLAHANTAKWVWLLCLVLGASVQAQTGGSALKIVVVDLDTVIINSRQGQALRTELEQFQQRIQQEADIMQGKARDIRQRIANGVNSLSDDQLAALQQDYEDEMIAIGRFRDDKQLEGQKKQQEGLSRIEKALEPVFEAIRDEYELDLILNRVPGVVVMAGERADITPLVIERLNQSP